MNTFQKVVIGVLAVLVLILGYGQFTGNTMFGAAGIGPNHYQAENFLQGLYAGTTGQLKVTNAGVLTTSGSLTIGSSGTAVSNYKCSSGTSYDPGSFSSSTIASTTVSVTGVVHGDITFGTFATSTNAEQWRVVTNVATSGQIVANWVAIPGTSAWNAALNLATSTLKICYLH